MNIISQTLFTETIIKCLQLMNRDDRIMVISKLEQCVIDTIIDYIDIDDSLRDLIVIESQQRIIQKLENTLNEVTNNQSDLQQKYDEATREIESLNKLINNMKVETRMLTEPEFFIPTEEELILGRDVGKVPSIKAYRIRTGVGLKTAKDEVERVMLERGWAFKDFPVIRNVSSNSFPA